MQPHSGIYKFRPLNEGTHFDSFVIILRLAKNWQHKKLLDQYKFAIVHKLDSCKFFPFFSKVLANIPFLNRMWFRKEFPSRDGRPFSIEKKVGSYKEIRFYSSEEIRQSKKERREELLKLKKNNPKYKASNGKYRFKPPCQVTLKYLINKQKLVVSFDAVHKNPSGGVMCV